MIKKKICMLGAFSVGKTSLVKRFVESIYSEKYQTTIGVKIDKKTVAIKDNEVNLILWDLPGEDDFQSIQTSYLRGASGYLLVVDRTRSSTLETALTIQKKTTEMIGNVPNVLVINKNDLHEKWELDESNLIYLSEMGLNIIKTSAKTGEGVEIAFHTLTELMLD